MKRLIYIALCLWMPMMVGAQGLLPVGQTTPGEIIAQSADNNTLYAIAVNDSKSYELWVLENEVWTQFGTIKNMPQHGSASEGDFEIKDAQWFNNHLYVLGDYKINTSGNQYDLVFEWDGSDWVDISNKSIRESAAVNQFVIFDGALYVVGVFEDVQANLLRLQSDKSWKAVGDWATINRNKDYIVDVHAYQGRLYASGRFTKKVGPDPYSTAIFDGQNWTSITHPPFLNSCFHFAEYNDGLVLTGNPNKVSDYVKSFNSVGWDDISENLDAYNLTTFWDVQSHNNTLYIAGDFTVKSNAKKFNLLIKDNDGWRIADWTYSNKPFHFINTAEAIYVVGGFDLYGIKNIARISSGHALLFGNIYEDTNTNCTFDTGEKGIAHQTLVLNPGNHVFWTDANGRYQIPVLKGNYTVSTPGIIKYVSPCASEFKISVDKAGNYQINDIGLQLKPNVVDLKVHSGLTNGYKLVSNGQNDGSFRLKNNGTVVIKEAKFVLTMTDMWSDISFAPNYDLKEGKQYIWTIYNLEVGEEAYITFSGYLKEGLTLADLNIEYEGIVVGPQSDIYLDDNSRLYELTVTDQLDPIYKQCGNGFYFNEESALNYYIRFTNVGKGSVKNIIVRDTIDEDIYLGRKGVEFYSSHPGSISHKGEFIEKNGKYQYVLFWTFTDINLPDSSAGGLKNVGFVEMNISMAKGYHPHGTMVCNEAEVFFDKQEPYITNEVCSEARNVSKGELPKVNAVKIYPNPVHDNFIISNTSTVHHAFEIYNTNGQLIQTAELPAGHLIDINVNTWAKGVYFVKINGYDCRKLIVQ